METYFSRNGQNHALALLKTRYEVSEKYALSLEAMSTFKLGGCSGFLINATPTVFWMLWHMSSASGLLTDLRNEIAAVVSEPPDLQRKEVRLDISKVQKALPSPFLQSIWKFLAPERTNACHCWVLDSALLTNHYMPRKNSAMEMPAQFLHARSSLWGTDFQDYNPLRFYNCDSPTIIGVHTRDVESGQHFVTTEMISVVAMMFLLFHIEPLASKEPVWPAMRLWKDAIDDSSTCK